MNYAMAKAMAAGAYRDTGEFDKAYGYLKDAYMIIAMEHGEDNLAAAAMLNSMGMLYKKWGKLDRALDAYERSLDVRERLIGEDHPETLTSRHNMAELFVEMKKPERAQELFDMNVTLMKKRQDE